MSAMDIDITLHLSFLVFTFGSLLVAVQIASGQLTPRIIVTALLRDNVIRSIVGLFCFGLLIAIGARNRLDTVPHFIVSLAAVIGLVLHRGVPVPDRLCGAHAAACVDRLARRRAGTAGDRDVYPSSIDATAELLDRPAAASPCGKNGRTSRHVGDRAGGKSAPIDRRSAEGPMASSSSCRGSGTSSQSAIRLFHLRGGATASTTECCGARSPSDGNARSSRIRPSRSASSLTLRSRRCPRPSTTRRPPCLSIDQLHRLLRMVGKRHLHDDQVFDRDGQLRVIFRTPDWGDFVSLACNEIRQYGAENAQIARRMRAMLENLLQTLPERRRPALRQELDLLDRTLERSTRCPRI